ncbi:MAG TPA: caspase family protein [Elusimicrobiota bacterium]|jgi:hypothetical protein|nr:caspase family protein [Elusimicrobiota bacterium]
MKRLVAAAFFAALAACAPQPIVLSYQPTGEAPSAGLPKPPRVYVEQVRDASGGLAFAGSGGSSFKPDVLRAPADAVTAALRDEVARVGLPPAASSAEADAVLSATIAGFKAYWDSGDEMAVEAELDLSVSASDARGHEVWAEKVAGGGQSLGLGGGVMGDAPNRALNAALAEGVTRAVAAFVARGVPALAAPAAASAPDASADQIVSDVDELPDAAAAPRRNAYAVVIGVERYRNDLPRADDAAHDARVTARYLTRVLGFPAGHVALLVDDHAAKADFEKYFERWLPNRVPPGGDVFVYYSGHGSPDAAKGAAYLVPYDGDPAYLEQTAYPLKRLYANLAALPARHVEIALDSCFSGRGGRSVIARGERPLASVADEVLPPNAVLLAASGADQVSNTYEEKGHGLFTYFFLKGLKEKGANLRAVFDYLEPLVKRVSLEQDNAEQDPQWRRGARS